MTREEQLACLTDRPCSVCKYHTEYGCSKWSCVFEEEPDDAENKGEDRPKSLWITYRNSDRCECANCGHQMHYEYPYCPNCGADMKGGE